VSERSRPRLFVLRVLVISLLATLFARLWYLQVLAGEQYARAASDNRVREVVTLAARGQILDDRGRPFIQNKTALVVSVDRTVLARQRDRGAGVLHRLAAVISMPDAELHARIQLCAKGVKLPCWNGSPYQPIPVTDRASTTMALRILERQETFAGVTAEVAAVRDYRRPAGANAAHLLGYLSPISDAELAEPRFAGYRRTDLIGRTGLEESYDSYLRGTPGVRKLAVDNLGAVTGLVQETSPAAGNNLVTSLDAGVQKVVEDALVHAVANAHRQRQPADSAAGIVLDAQTGHVVAMASYPTYRPDVFNGGISERNFAALRSPAAGIPLLNRAVQGRYAPGSTFKLVSTAGVVSEGTASFSGRYPCPSSVKLGDRVFRNFEGEFLGDIDLHTTLVKSCDTVYYGFANTDWYRDEALVRAHRPPVEAVQKMARAFGFGRDTGIDLPAESSGTIEDRATKLKLWRDFVRPNACAGAKRFPPGSFRQRLDAENCTDGWRFRLGDQANFDIGQGTVLVTPLQLATAYAALVNGGRVFSPRLGKAVVDTGGHVVRAITCPVRSKVPVSRKTLNDIAAALYDVPRQGTARGAFAGFPFDRVAVGGKTGTAQLDNNKRNDASWFASFAGPPGSKSQFVAVVMVPKGGQGGRVAAPAVREIWEGIYGLRPGSQAVLPGGRLPTALPATGVGGTGTAAAPGASFSVVLGEALPPAREPEA
jgi:penicillin-binding protein 2